MKILIIIVVLSFTVGPTFSQDIDNQTQRTIDEYLQKSKSQKIGGFVLLGVGATSFIIAAPGNVSFDLLPILVIGGGAAVLGSIPLFIASGKNKKRALKLQPSISMERINLFQNESMVPSLGIAINFN